MCGMSSYDGHLPVSRRIFERGPLHLEEVRNQHGLFRHGDLYEENVSGSDSTQND